MILAPILLVSLAGSVGLAAVPRLGRNAHWVLALLPAGLFAAFVRAAPTIAAGGTIRERMHWIPSLGIELSFRLDGFSLLFALLITGIGALVVVYAGAYLNDHTLRSRARFAALILAFMTSMLGAVLADDLIVLYLFWEATSIISFLLIGFDVASPSAKRSALMSLRVTAAGGLALLAAVLLIGQTLGTYSLSAVTERAGELTQSPLIVPILAGVFIGAFTKSAQFPFHIWLPNAMQAPTPASAYLHSATMVKLGVYLLARFEPVFGRVPGARDVVIAVALATMLVGAFQALRAENFKTVLAYSTVASLGILVMLVGLDGPMASVATVGFILSHALYKATLFFCAGTVLHATGLTKLRALGGLGRKLPFTAAASLLASLSMAGLPPFIGFISKEFLFEAQIRSSWDAAPMAVAVLVNAVIVAVAGVVTLRPFFMGRFTGRTVRHPEVAGLLVPPLLLAFLGLAISLEPDWITRSVVGPAATAIYGTPIDVSVDWWHGITPVLALSTIVVAAGALIFANWTRIHRRLRRESPLDRYEAEHAYEAVLRGLESLARATARRIQHGDLRRHLVTILVAITAVLSLVLGAGGAAIRWPSYLVIRIGPAAIALVAIVAGVAAARMRSLVAVMVSVGLAGFVTALTFMLNGAPDLALTQFAVESLIVVLLTTMLFVIPLRAAPTRVRGERWRDGILATIAACVVFIIMVDMTAPPASSDVTDFYGAHSLVEAFGRNVVNVILVDFRAFDTLGETMVIGAAAVIVWSLLGNHQNGTVTETARSRRPAPFILSVMTPVFFGLLLVLSIAALLGGHNTIGGGFVGGLTAGLAFAVLAFGRGGVSATRPPRVHPLALVGTGLLLALASGLPGLAHSGQYLQHRWFHVAVLGASTHQGTPLLFDIGVYLTVVGAVMAFMFALSREADA